MNMQSTHIPLKHDESNGIQDPCELPVDYQTKAFVLSLSLLVFLLTFGLETHLLVQGGNYVIPAIIVVVIVCIVTILQYKLTLKYSKQASVLVGKKPRRMLVNLRPANEKTQEYVNDRARLFGLAKVQVFSIPKTLYDVDGYAVGGRRNPKIVLTVGAQALLFSKIEHDQSQFKFLIDHELAHIANGDTTSMYRARALLYTACFAILAKAAVWWLLDWKVAMRYYEPLFPRSLHTGTTASVFPVLQQKPTSIESVFLFVVVYTATTLCLMVITYIAIVRHREFWADRVAVQVRDNQDEARSAFRSIAQERGVVSLAINSFAGNQFWHPSRKARLANVESDSPTAGYYYGITSFISVLVLTTVRLVVANNAMPNSKRSFEAGETTILFSLSMIYLFICAYSTRCIIFPVCATNGRILPAWIGLRALCYLCINCVLVAGFLY